MGPDQRIAEDSNISRRVDLDIWHIENWSIGWDLKILLKMVFSGMASREPL